MTAQPSKHKLLLLHWHGFESRLYAQQSSFDVLTLAEIVASEAGVVKLARRCEIEPELLFSQSVMSLRPKCFAIPSLQIAIVKSRGVTRNDNITTELTQ